MRDGSSEGSGNRYSDSDDYVMRFSKEDFLGQDMSPPTDSLSRFGLLDYQAERIAKIANDKVSAWVAEAPEVFAVTEGSCEVDGTTSRSWRTWRDLCRVVRSYTATHKARLVFEEKLP